MCLKRVSSAQPSLMKPQSKGPVGIRFDQAVSGYATQLFRLLEKIARRKVLTCALLTVLPVALRLSTLGLIPIPQPQFHDEFSYLLAGETFASGRLTNPPHPMWVHFETFHELFQPTYMSKYPPGQGLFLALGLRLFGHPWYGVVVSFGFFCACLCWMLQGWLPPVWALLGTLLSLCQITVYGPWMNSYWGGAVAAAGGCLMLGALPRLAGRPTARHTVIAGLGLMILAISRPYEGLVLSIAAAAALVWWRRRRNRPFRDMLLPRVAFPFLLICALGVAFNLYYNYRITGNALTMPYLAYDRAYTIAPPFIILPEKQTPAYLNEVIERFWKDFDLARYHERRANALRNFATLLGIFPFYCSNLLLVTLGSAVIFSRSIKVWIATVLATTLSLGLTIETFMFARYLAPGASLIPLIAVQGLRVLRTRAKEFGIALVLLFLISASANIVSEAGQSLLPSRSAKPRAVAAGIALRAGGKHLILVRYAPTHDLHSEYVFNSASIDSSSIVWARDMGAEKNKEIIGYYPDRKVWLWQPDKAIDALTPY